MPKLLISVINEKETLEAITGGADIIDVKNPREGSLGANFSWVIKKISRLIPRDIELSATIGDFPNLPGTASLAAFGAAVTGADYVKIGIYGVNSFNDALQLSKAFVKAIKLYDKKKKAVIAGYADFERVGSLDPFSILEIGRNVGADFLMIDTAIKDGKTLFDFISLEKLKRFTTCSHEYGIKVAFGGSLKKEHLEPLCRIDVDVIGIRGEACGGDRLNGEIRAENVQELKEIISNVRI